MGDLRYALRLMRRSPACTAVAVVSLALGIGANTAIFSLLNTVLLRTLPVDHPEQLVELLQHYPNEPRGNSWTWASFQHFSHYNHVFSGLTATSFDNLVRMRAEGFEPAAVVGEGIADNYFRVLGLKPALGRWIDAGEDSAAVLSWACWSNRFHGGRQILGRKILVNGAPMTIVGVAPRGYDGPRVGVATEIWTRRENKDGLSILARLQPGATLEQARAEMAVLFRFTIEEHPRHAVDPQVRRMRAEVEPAGSGLANVRDQIGQPLKLLMAVAASLLLLACINLASLLVARGAARQKELAVRVAIGAGRIRLARQMLTESLLLSSLGTAAGVVLAYFGMGMLLAIMASARPLERIEIHVRPDGHLLLFTAAMAVLTGVLFGLAPAWFAWLSAPAMALRQTGRGETGAGRWLGRTLVTAQVALSVLLVTAAAVFMGHLSRLRTQNLGFRSDHVLLLMLDPSASGYPRDQLAARYQELLARTEGIPGVRSAALCACSPIQGCGASRFVTAEGFVERPEQRHWTALSWVSPKYFATMGTPLLAGRDFSFDDAGRRKAIISESTARHYFPGVNPIGRQVTIEVDPNTGGWTGDPTFEVIGVVADSRMTELREPQDQAMYFNMFQGGRIYNQLALRTSGRPESVAGAVERAVREGVKQVAVTRETTLADQVDAAIVPERLLSTLSEYFGSVGALLAGIGLYGLLAYAVARRTSEIGVRMALGATAGNIGRLVVSEALAMAATGIAAGAGLVMWCRPVAQALIPDLKMHAMAAAAIGGAVVMAMAIAASYVPARRAARVDPMTALREE